MRRPFPALAAWAVLGGCILVPTREEIVQNRISIQVTDSVMFYDETRVTLFRAGTADTFHVAWSGYLDSASRLLDIRPPGYRGEPVDVLIESSRGGVRGLRILAAWNARQRRHVASLLPPDPDTVKPVIKLHDTGFFYLAGETYQPPALECYDNFDRYIWTMTWVGSVDTHVPGDYPIEVRCVDGGGNEARLPLTAKVIPRPTRIPAYADTYNDPAVSGTFNTGLSPVLLLGGEKATLFQFDMRRLLPEEIKSAKLRLHAFGIGPWNGTTAKVLFRFRRLGWHWVEGSGNPWYFDGTPQPGSAEVLGRYSQPPQVLSASRNPAVSEGMTAQQMGSGLEYQLLRDEAGFAPSQCAPSWPGPIPGREDLKVMEVDVTTFLRATHRSHPGLELSVQEFPEGLGLGILSREVDDGSLAASLILEY